MKILIAGSSGLVGRALVAALRGEGHTVAPLVRPGRTIGPNEVRWDPETGELGADAAGADAVVNLGGASIAEGRWNDRRKQILRSSRVDATRNLVQALRRLPAMPAVLVSASAVGYYGNRGDELLTEARGPGSDFLAAVARDWEAEALRAESAGIRVVVLRFGMILAARGGALAKMLPLFRLGLGGKLSSGEQWISWITLSEVVKIIRETMEKTAWQGVFNAVAPNPVTNAQFTRTLGRVLRRPAVLPAPAFALRLALGEMADALLLSSQRAIPKRLDQSGYLFVHAELEEGLRSILLPGN